MVEEKREIFYQKEREYNELLREELGEEGYQEYLENLRKKGEEWNKKKEKIPKSFRFMMIAMLIFAIIMAILIILIISRVIV